MGSLTAESQNLLDQKLCSFAPDQNFFQIICQIGSFFHVIECKFGKTDNRSQNIIKIVRNSAGKCADGLQFLCLPKLVFEILLFGDIADRRPDLP